MGRSGSGIAFRFTFILLVLASFVGCGKNNAVNTTSFAIPATISLIPNPTTSIEVGTSTTFTATPLDATKKTIVEPITYVSSNPAVVTVAANGLACAGSWDSVTNPQICTPGSVGVAQITATAQGVSSPTTTVYVHQHITSISISQFTPANTPPPASCQSLSQNSIPQSAYYQATAYTKINGQLLDITATVGQFNWQPLTIGVAKFSNTATILANMVGGVSLNQVQVTANTPGTTQFFASIGNSTSVPFTFVTCPVQSIEMTVTSSESNSKTIKATATDILGNKLSTAPLTWSSSQAGNVTVTSGGTSGSDTATASLQATGGGATIIASCTPPTCNVGFYPSLPTYPENVVTLSGKAGTSAQFTVYVSTTGCGTTDGCFTALLPIVYPSNTTGNVAVLSTTPDSMLFNRQGTKIYFGTDSGLAGSKGLSIFDTTATSVTQYTSAPGKVLAVSPDGNKIVVSDTKDAPSRVFVVDVSSAAPSSVALPISGATAASFSPDSLKAFIVAGTNLYVYSKTDSLKTIPLNGTATDVAFLAEGAVGYMAGGDPAGVSFLPTCYDPAAGPALGNVTVPGAQMIRALPDGATMLTLAPPNIQTFSVALGGQPQTGLLLGCPQPLGYITVTNTPNPAVNLGQGTFTAKQLIISQDGSTAYIFSPNFTSVLAFSIGGLTTKGIPLTGNASPLQADISPDGTRLFVMASDGQLHVLDTGLLSDVLQTSFPENFCLNSAGGPETFNCSPDLIAVKP